MGTYNFFFDMSCHSHIISTDSHLQLFILVKIVCEPARDAGEKTLKGACILGLGFPLLVLGSVRAIILMFCHHLHQHGP